MCWRVIISVAIFVLFSDCLNIVPEYAATKYVNEKYASNVTVDVQRSSQKGEYLFNMALMNKYPTGNNVTLKIFLNLILYEYTGQKQYVPTMIEFHYKWCDLILYDKWFGLFLRKTGVTKCLIPVGPISISNMSFTGHVPFDVPFEKGKFEGISKVKCTGEVMISIYVIVNFVK